MKIRRVCFVVPVLCAFFAVLFIACGSKKAVVSETEPAADNRPAEVANVPAASSVPSKPPIEMVLVKGGEFRMGNPGSMTSRQRDRTAMPNNEWPSHRVTLRDYYIGKYEVTQKLWQAVMGTNIRQQRDLANKSWSLYGEGDDYPMYYINYNECEEFCAKLNKLLANQLPEGYKFRLPTEAQWEYAAKGGSNSLGYTYSGSNNLGEVAWYRDNRPMK